MTIVKAVCQHCNRVTVVPAETIAAAAAMEPLQTATDGYREAAPTELSVGSEDLAETTVTQLHPEVDDSGKPYLPYAESFENTERLIRARSVLWNCSIEACAALIEKNIIMDTSAGKVLAPRQDGNRDGLHYAAAIRALASSEADG